MISFIYCTFYHEIIGFKQMSKHEDIIMTNIMKIYKFADDKMLEIFKIVLESFHAFLVEKRSFFKLDLRKSDYSKFVLHNFANFKCEVIKTIHDKNVNAKFKIDILLNRFAQNIYFEYETSKYCDLLKYIFLTSLEPGNKFMIKDMSFCSQLGKYGMDEYQNIISEKKFYKVHLRNKNLKLQIYQTEGISKSMCIQFNFAKTMIFAKRKKRVLSCETYFKVNDLIYEFFICLRFIKNYSEEAEISYDCFILAIQNSLLLLGKIYRSALEK